MAGGRRGSSLTGRDVGDAIQPAELPSNVSITNVQALQHTNVKTGI